MRVCTSCKVELTETNWPQFHRDKTYYSCRDCVNRRNKEYYARNREARKLAMRAGRYGITVKDISDMERRQEGKCEICKEPCASLHVDHNHVTGEVRSLLCSGCNTGLGLFKENPLYLESAIRYLNKHSKEEPQC